RRHAGALTAGHAIAVADGERAARVVRGFGDGHAVEGAPPPVDGIGGDEQALERVVGDRTVLQRVATTAERERAQGERDGEPARSSAARGRETAEHAQLSLGSGW